MRYKIVWLIVLLVVSCTPKPEATLAPDTAVTSPPVGAILTSEPNLNPFKPKPGDENLTRGHRCTGSGKQNKGGCLLSC